MIIAPPSSTENSFALELRDVTLSVMERGNPMTVVQDISFTIGAGEFYALVGESGSGKTMIARSIMRLLPDHILKIDGEILFDGQNLARASEKELRRLRGGSIAMIFQEPMSSLNPLMVVEDQIGEAVVVHRQMNRRERREIIEKALMDVRLPDPRKIMRMYPHELSGGMRQRVMIATALVNGPRLLIADEPTTALDVTIQKEIMEIIGRLSADHQLAVLFISHDLALVRQYADRVGVLYGGTLMEEGATSTVICKPAHPYTAALLDCVPRRRKLGERQSGIEGSVPSIRDWSAACRFIDRCRRPTEACRQVVPVRTGADGRRVRCVAPAFSVGDA